MLITGHQGFFTTEALTNLAATTIADIDAFERTGRPLHPIKRDIQAQASTAIEAVPA